MSFLFTNVCSLLGSDETLQSNSDNDTRNRFHHLRLPQISCSEGKAVQVASVFLGRLGGWGGGGGRGDFVLLTSNRSFDN